MWISELWFVWINKCELLCEKCSWLNFKGLISGTTSVRLQSMTGKKKKTKQKYKPKPSQHQPLLLAKSWEQKFFMCQNVNMNMNCVPAEPFTLCQFKMNIFPGMAFSQLVCEGKILLCFSSVKKLGLMITAVSKHNFPSNGCAGYYLSGYSWNKIFVFQKES